MTPESQHALKALVGQLFAWADVRDGEEYDAAKFARTAASWSCTMESAMSAAGMKPLLVVAFAAMVPLANYLIGHVGTCLAGGPCVIPVAPGIVAPSGVLAIGLAFVLRDLVQRRMGKAWSLVAIAAGAALSLAVAPPSIALASIASYLVSELTDFGVYTALVGRGLVLAVAASGLISAAVDSAAFLQIGFGSLAFMPGQLIGKAWGIVVSLPVVARLRAAR